jgi:predicted aspartyl protease
VVEKLGLAIKRRIVATTAAGDIETTIHDQAKLSVAGREGVVECIALPDGARPLLGVIPLEMLGLEPDLVGQTLRVLPDNNKDTYIFAY